MSFRRKISKYLIVWFDQNVQDSNDRCQIPNHLHTIADSIKTFSNLHACVDFLMEHDDENEQIFVLLSGSTFESIVPIIHQMKQIHSLHIYDPNRSNHLFYGSQKYTKVKDPICDDVQSACEQIKKNILQYRNGSITISFISPSEMKSETRHDPSFMYNQLLKEILLENNENYSDDNARNEMLEFCRKNYENNQTELAVIEEFEREYFPEHSIYWYTRECFLYNILNKALWASEPASLYKLRYIIRHLHEQIVAVAAKQSTTLKPMVVFRGQGISNQEFKKLSNGIGGLLSFSSFLSTSLDENVASDFAKLSTFLSDQTSVIFSMSINPTIQNCSFINVGTMSYYEGAEKEILFSCGTVFRVDAFEKLHDNQWKIHLTSNNDTDVKLLQYMEHMRQRIHSNHPLTSLVKLVDEMGQYKALDPLENIFIDRSFTFNNRIKLGGMQHAIGSAYLSARNRAKALTYLKDALNTYLEFLPPNHPSLTPTYNNIGSVYHANHEYETALNYQQLALDCQLNAPDPDLDSIATYSMNIANVYEALGKHEEASKHQTRALELRQQSHGNNDPSLLETYTAIGRSYYEKEDYEKAAIYHGKALELQKIASNTNPVAAATCFISTGQLNLSQGLFDEAIDHFKKALEIQTKYLLPNHPTFAATYTLLARTYYQQEKFAKSIPYYLKVIEIEKDTLDDDHPTIATSYFNLSTAYFGILQYDEALEAAKKSVEQLRKRHNIELPNLAMFLQQIGSILYRQNKYFDSIDYYQESLAVRLEFDDNNNNTNSSLAVAYFNIAEVYSEIKNYPKALSYYIKTLENEQNNLVDDHPTIAVTYFKISQTYFHMLQYDEALIQAEKCVNQLKKRPNPDKLKFGAFLQFTGLVLHKQKKYSEALDYYLQSLPNMLSIMDTDDIRLAGIYHSIAGAYYKLDKYDKALPFYEKTLKIELIRLPKDAPTIATTYSNISTAFVGLKRYDEAIDACQMAIDQLLKTCECNSNEIQHLCAYLDQIKTLQLLSNIYK